MVEVECPGLPAEWLNAWLAAVGITVLDSRIKLRWTDDAYPRAVLSADDSGNPIDFLLESWPSAERIGDMPIANKWPGTPNMGRKVPLEVFIERARASRSHPDSWTLSSTMTDLHIEKNGEVAHAHLDPPGPGSIKWLHHRLNKSYSLIDSYQKRVPNTLLGRGLREHDNGLGFDLSRVTSLADDSSKTVDPVVEVMTFFGLALFPARSIAYDAALGGRSPQVKQRGWKSGQDELTGYKRPYLEWAAWRQALDRAGIDALLDVFYKRSRRKSISRRLGITRTWQTISFESRASADPTVGFGAKLI